HGGRQTQRLTDHLVALRIGVARKVGNVERERGPEADICGERREEETPELARLFATVDELRGLREDRPEAAGFLVRPPQQQQTERDQQRRLENQEKAYGLDAAIDHEHVDRPERQEARELGRVNPQKAAGQ